ncbi:MAG: D-2-hydroxyacid dehydrogenase [Chloroflexota bacterium]
MPDEIGVLVNFPLESEYVEAIEAVDLRVRVLRVYEPKGEGTAASDEAGDAWRQVTGDELDALLARAQIYFGFRFPVEWLDRSPRLKWAQLSSAGSDHMLRAGLFDKRPDLLLTTASGVHEIPISEHIIAMILHFSRGIDIAVRNQALHRWERYSPREANGASVCMVGYGPIARRAAILCKSLGMTVSAVRASLNEQMPTDGVVERFYPVHDLNSVLAESDYVVIAAPRTPQSEGMIGKEQFAVMKPGAVLINISRGALVDQPTMIEALQQGRLGGAGLDVVEPEPLPEDSPLWDMSHVLITPHVSGSNPNYNKRVTELFTDNLARYLKGEPLKNSVEKERGY